MTEIKLSEGLKQVQDALEQLVNNGGFYTEERFCLAKAALDLFPAMISQTEAIEKPVDDKLHNIMLAHLDGVYRLSARSDCDTLATRIIGLAIRPQAAPPSMGEQEVDEGLRQAAHDMIRCAEAWEPQCRLIGNVRAADVEAVCVDYLNRLRLQHAHIIRKDSDHG